MVSTQSAALPKSFLDELVDLTSKNRVSKVKAALKEIQDDCRRAAKDGKNYASYSHYVVEDKEELRAELDILGLTVTKISDIGGKFLSIDVTWPVTPSNKKRKLENGTGNLEMKCGVCYATSPMKRLHPCGHLLGNCCNAALVSHKCPFCRQEVAAVHSIYRP